MRESCRIACLTHSAIVPPPAKHTGTGHRQGKCRCIQGQQAEQHRRVRSSTSGDDRHTMSQHKTRFMQPVILLAQSSKPSIPFHYVHHIPSRRIASCYTKPQARAELQNKFIACHASHPLGGRGATIMQAATVPVRHSRPQRLEHPSDRSWFSVLGSFWTRGHSESM